MKVKLIQVTQNPIDVMWTAARTCYSEKSPIEMWDDRDGEISDGYEHTEEYKNQCEDKRWNLVKKVLNSGHSSIAEHCYFTFAIEGISRACSHQLVRHRAGIVFSQQSQRYVEIKESKQELMEILNRYEGPEMKEICDKYFVDFKDRIDSNLIKTLCEYRDLVDGGCKAEDARNVLPNATKTNITMSVNFRELIHLCNLRLCTRAQKEIRDLFKLIVKEVETVDGRIASYLVPSCEVHNMCFEAKCCGRKPRVDEVKGAYKLLGDDTILSNEDWEQLMDSISNPKFNQKLKDFMNEKSTIEGGEE
jgi:thymidylate synthase (FAD)